MAKAYTLEQLKYADEICFLEDFEKITKEIAPKDWIYYVMSFKNNHHRSLLEWIFAHSRASQDRGMREVMEGILDRLLIHYVTVP